MCHKSFHQVYLWARIEPLTDERAISLRNGFIGILHESKRKLNE